MWEANRHFCAKQWRPKVSGALKIHMGLNYTPIFYIFFVCGPHSSRISEKCLISLPEWNGSDEKQPEQQAKKMWVVKNILNALSNWSKIRYAYSVWDVSACMCKFVGWNEKMDE